MMNTFWKDIRFGIRMMGKAPGFTLTAIFILALGIGLNTAIFSVLNAILLRTLPVPNPHELRLINWTGHNPKLSYYIGFGTGHMSSGRQYASSFPYPAYQIFREQGEGISDVFAFFPIENITTLTRGTASTQSGLMVSGNFFSGYGEKLIVGRSIIPDDDQLGDEPVAVITHRLWEKYFALDPNVLGETITLNKQMFTIIGVLSPEFVGPQPGDPTDVYIPFSAQPLLQPERPLNSSKHWWVQIMARMEPGANEKQTQAALTVLFKQVLNESVTSIEEPEIWLEDGSRGPLLMRQRIAMPVWALLAVVGLVLLIACVNLASLLLVRSSTRQHEMAVRTAIGAGRWHLIRQSLIESILLAFAGTALGFLFSIWCKEFLLRVINRYQSQFRFDFHTDANVLLFALCLTVVTVLLFGLLPALRVSSVSPTSGLKESVGNFSPRLRLGKVLVSIQVGLSVLLVVGAGLMIQTFTNLKNLELGFDVENLLLFRLNAQQADYDETQRLRFFEQLQQSISAIPGVRNVALSDLALVSGHSSANGLTIPGRPADPEVHMQACQLVVNESFFSTMNLPILLGREFTSSDTKSGPEVSIVNQAFAESFFPGESALGQTFQIGGDTEYKIIGICRDSLYDNLRKEVQPIMFFPYKQMPVGAMYFEIRSTLPALSLMPAIRKVVSSFDNNIPLENVKTQRQQLDETIFLERFVSSLCGVLALLAVFLSCIGLYGLMAYSVSSRRSEIGIRMALGARPHDVALPIMREAVVLAGIGIAAGIPVAVGLASIIRSVLFGITPYDPITLIIGALLLLSVAALSAWLPARRAARVDPMNALRYE